MYHEFVAIFSARMSYVMMREHRFIFNLGYGFDDNSAEMTSAALIFASLFVELIFEIIIDTNSLTIEWEHGIDCNYFWSMFADQPAMYTFVFFAHSATAMLVSVWSFSTIPTPFFCTSPVDPCSCKSSEGVLNGGFSIVAKFCNRASETNSTGANSTATTTNTATAKRAYQSVFDILGQDIMVVLATVAAAIIISLIFWIAYKDREVVSSKVDVENLQIKNNVLALKNKEIQEELMLNNLNEDQRSMIEKNKEDLLESLMQHQLEWRGIKFQTHLGSGSFGDCYRGVFQGNAVAIKKMRATLVDEKGFKAFCQEINMLSVCVHENLVNFVGYCLKPVLLIIMEFVDGGTLTSWIKANKNLQMSKFMEGVLPILLDCVAGLEFLHCGLVDPIVHRDIKSENILITSEGSAKIADLGEARTVSRTHTMTTVGTNGYTAPEVLKAERYGPPADIFSLAIVMSECISRAAPYSNMLKDANGKNIASWDQIVEMTKVAGLRPVLPNDVDPMLGRLIRECWSADPDERPNCSVLFLRLKDVALRILRQSGAGSRILATGSMHLEVQDPMLVENICRDLSQLLWSAQTPKLWDIELAKKVLKEDATVTARDKTLAALLEGEKGPESLRALSRMMFSGECFLAMARN